MDDPQVTVQRFSWPDLFPALLLFRSLPAALSMTVLVLSLFAVAATPIGWIVMEKLVVGKDLAADLEFQAIAEVNRSPYKHVYPKWSHGDSLLTVLGHQVSGVSLVFKSAIDSIRGVFSLQHGLNRFFYFLGGAVWTIIVWTFFGCGITRTALMRYTREEPIGIDDAFDYSFDKFFSCFGGVMIPLLAIFGLTIPMAAIGFLMASNFGVAIGGFLWFFVLILSLIIGLIGLGLMFAWPLIVSAISCEGQDSFDGMSRAFAYVFQRPVQYFCYALIAVVFSGVCWLVASNLIEGSIRTAFWATSWGTNVSGYRTSILTDEVTVELNNMEEMVRQKAAAGEDLAPKALTGDPVGSPTSPVPGADGVSVPNGGLTPQTTTPSIGATPEPNVTSNDSKEESSLTFGKRMIKFWNNVARTLGSAFLYGLFWCLAAGMYLLLRKDLDDTETDEIFLVDDRRTFDLPSLKDDPSGVPQIDEDAVLPAKVDPPSSSDSPNSNGD